MRSYIKEHKTAKIHRKKKKSATDVDVKRHKNKEEKNTKHSKDYEKRHIFTGEVVSLQHFSGIGSLMNDFLNPLAGDGIDY